MNKVVEKKYGVIDPKLEERAAKQAAQRVKVEAAKNRSQAHRDLFKRLETARDASNGEPVPDASDR